MFNAQVQPRPAVAPQDISAGFVHGHEAAAPMAERRMRVAAPHASGVQGLR